MNDYRINLNYAKALFLLAHDLNQVDEITGDMSLVGEVCAENHLLNKVLGNPIIREDRKREVVKDIFTGHVSPATLAFLIFVVKHRRGVNLGGIAKAYMRLYRESKGIVLANVITASEMDDGLIERLRAEVSGYTGKTVELHHQVSDEMLGGFQLLFDTYLVDARLQTRIDRMRRAFSKNIYESKL